MAGITQTVPNYGIGGISEQPDQLKQLGQVKDAINVVPDITYGMYKRPGSKRIGLNPLTNVQSGGSWFHYYRDEVEGSYIGQVAADGKIRMWCTKDIKNSAGTVVSVAGSEVFVHYDTVSGAYTQSNYDSSNAAHTAISSYLTPSPSTDTEDIQATTVNDTTFLNNRSIIVETEGTTEEEPDPYFAFIDILRTENGRQYGFNLYRTNALSTITTATRLKWNSDNLDEGGSSGDCPSIGTQVFSGADTDTAGKTNLSYRLTVLGQQGRLTGDGTQESHYSCTYNREVTLLHGGEGWDTNDTADPVFDNCKTSFQPTIKVTAHEELQVTADIKAVRPAPTPFDADTAVTIDSVLGGMQSAISGALSKFVIPTTDVDTAADTITSSNHKLSTGNKIRYDDDGGTPIGGLAEGTDYYVIKVDDNTIKLATSSSNATAGTAIDLTSTGNNNTQYLYGTIEVQQIGTGLYLSCSVPFNVEVLDNDLMRVMQSTVNDVTKLPLQCKHGYIVKVSNTRMSDEDDYYVKFFGQNNQDGVGIWQECAKPGIIKSFKTSTMPHVLQRQSISGSNPVIFLVKPFEYTDRNVGDDLTCPIPSFVGQSINKVVFFRNRLVFLSGESVICSRPGSINNPNFWNNSALTIGAIDPVDISCASIYPSDLFDAIEITTGLLCFSSNQQFLLCADDTVFNPDTAKLRTVSNHNYNKVIPPIKTNLTIGFIDNSFKYSRFIELGEVRREGEPAMVETSKLVPSLLPKGLDLITSSIENSTVFFGKSGSDTVYGFRYFRLSAQDAKQASWFKWKFNRPIKYHFCIEDFYYFLDEDNFLQSINFIQSDDDPTITVNDISYLVHLDNYVEITGGSYDNSSNKTTYTHGSGGAIFDWQSNVGTPNGDLVVLSTGTSCGGTYFPTTVTGTGTSFTIPGDSTGSGTEYIGYLYCMQVDFPRIYRTQQQGQSLRSDINSRLTVHRVKLNFGKIGLYETTLTREGKDPYTEVWESSPAGQYLVGNAPYLDEEIRDIPVYEKNDNVDITLKSCHPAPAVLHSMAWEGDYSPMHYQRT